MTDWRPTRESRLVYCAWEVQEFIFVAVAIGALIGAIIGALLTYWAAL